jgi:hypothetical protein
VRGLLSFLVVFELGVLGQLWSFSLWLFSFIFPRLSSVPGEELGLHRSWEQLCDVKLKGLPSDLELRASLNLRSEIYSLLLTSEAQPFQKDRILAMLE